MKPLVHYIDNEGTHELGVADTEGVGGSLMTSDDTSFRRVGTGPWLLGAI